VARVPVRSASSAPGGAANLAAVSRRGFTVGAIGAVGMVLLDACSRSSRAVGTKADITSNTPSLAGATPTSTTKPPAAPASIVVSPASGATAVNPTEPIKVTVSGGSVTAVTVLSSSGAKVSGTLSPDGSTWTSSEPLGYQRDYTLTAAAVNTDGVPAAATAKFSTLTPGNMTMPYFNTRGGTTLTNGGTFGIGMVVRLHFDEPITDKAAAEKALVVTTTPALTGGWYWLDDQDVLWRPESFYPAGTKVRVEANVYGVEVGPGLYGQSDASVSFVIGRKQLSIADDRTHQVSVYFDDVLQRTMPTSMGKGGYITGDSGQTISFYTPPGTYTVLDKSNPVLMSSASYGLPADAPGGYEPEDIYWATRISIDGIYLHELDTTIWAQGNTDTSHGCLNLNQANARWFYQTSQIGDPVTVKYTGGAPLALWQNGDWSQTWAQWQAGSALHG
jgi:lipoprotein-anchoring transpeptidase ErfK/SrfK